MKMKRRIRSYRAAAIALAAIPGLASAAGLGNIGQNWGPNQSLYLGLGAGKSHFNNSFGGDNSDFGWKGFVGFNANQYFGVEGFYTHLGQASGPRGTVKAGGFGLDGVARYKMGQWAPLVKLGFWYPHANGSFGSDHSFELTYGLGVNYDLTNNLGLRAEVERYRLNNNATNGQFDSLLWSANLMWHLR